MDATLEKIVLMLLATPGISAPAAKATKPANKAYSIKSCPSASAQRRLSLIRMLAVRFTTSILLAAVGWTNRVKPLLHRGNDSRLSTILSRGLEKTIGRSLTQVKYFLHSAISS